MLAVTAKRSIARCDFVGFKKQATSAGYPIPIPFDRRTLSPSTSKHGLPSMPTTPLASQTRCIATNSRKRLVGLGHESSVRTMPKADSPRSPGSDSRSQNFASNAKRLNRALLLAPHCPTRHVRDVEPGCDMQPNRWDQPPIAWFAPTANAPKVNWHECKAVPLSKHVHQWE